MPIVVKEVIYLGTFFDADTNEGTLAVENTGIYQQTFGSAGSPLNNSRESISLNDQDNSGTLETNNVGTTDTTDGAGGVAQVDSLAVVNATITYLDGTSATYGNVVMFQTANGDLFLSNSDFAGTDIRGPDIKELQSITVNSITSTSYSALFHNNFQSFACFAEGTRLATPDGSLPIETLKVGDLVQTLDHGAQAIRWIGRSTVLQMGKMSPVCIAPGSLGCGLPLAELRVSQHHRMLIRSSVVERMTGSYEALIAAKFLLPITGIELKSDIAPISYLHLLFDRHEILNAEGAPSESLFPGDQALEMLGPECSKEINSLLLKMESWRDGGSPARDILVGRLRRQAIDRHLKNAKPVLATEAPKYKRAIGAKNSNRRKLSTGQGMSS
ncbi:Hint domain-containing protein [Litoreibacter sp.]|nr:Hint domain-containing protein [Litoreibacter sp.]